jgi:uncharacterized membrane protein
MTPIGAVHTILAFVAVGAGAVVTRLPKGTRWHRTFGHLYASALLGTVVTAFALYNLTGGLGPFHVAAVVGGVTLGGGLWTVLGRRPRKNWIEAHAIWMSWSYIGLMAALVSETATRFVMPRVASYFEGSSALWAVFWGTVVAASITVLVVGMWFLKHRLPGAIAKTPEVMRRERRRLAELDEGAAGTAAS